MNGYTLYRATDDIFAHLDRRDALLRLRIRCPACDDVQVQILTAHVPLAQALYRCRICRTRFVMEGEFT